MIHLEREVGGRTLSIEYGRVAKQAGGSALVRYGDTVVLVTAVMSSEIRSLNFMPLLVEYREMVYAAGKIPGSILRREGRPSEKEVLTSRMIDRPIRPLFPDGLYNDVQIVAMVLCVDQENDPDVVAMIGAGAALAASDIPVDVAVAAARVAKVDGQFVHFPTYEQCEQADFVMVAAGTKNAITMMELSGNQAPEEDVLAAAEEMQALISGIAGMVEEYGRQIGAPKRKVELFTLRDDVHRKVLDYIGDRLQQVAAMEDKAERQIAHDALKADVLAALGDESDDMPFQIRLALERIDKDNLKKHVFELGKRVDGRGFDEIRNIECEVGILPRTHGSALFTRGQTQSMAVTTLGTAKDEQRIGLAELKEEVTKTFMLHYNFPPFSVGEVKPMRGPSRRDIGHGALAEKSIRPVLPTDTEEFPYTIRIVSEIFESNGSSSMASVCGSSLSLMDAGVPITDAVAGISVGMIIGDNGAQQLLTDIAGVEDHQGNMDFKVAGTRSGITAIQMDCKCDGLTMSIVRDALDQAKRARMSILDRMESCIAAPRDAISDYAPRIIQLTIPTEKIREIIGPGGKIIRAICEKTGAEINVEDDGTVQIASPDMEKVREAEEMVRNIVAEAEIGKVYQGKVTRLMGFGAFVEILPGKEGLVRVANLAKEYVESPEDVVKEGDPLEVRVIEIDSQGRINLTAVLDQEPRKSPPRRDGGRGGSRRGGGGGGRGDRRGGGGGGGSRGGGGRRRDG